MAEMHPVVSRAADMIASGDFDAEIESIIVQTVRNGRDKGLSRIGFILKMAVEIIDRCARPMGLQEAKKLAFHAYKQFRRDNKVSFGDEGWDWSGDGARTVAHEYEIDHWEPHP